MCSQIFSTFLVLLFQILNVFNRLLRELTNVNFAVFKFTQEPKVCYLYIKSLFLGYAFRANFLGLRVDFAVSVKILSSKRRERC